MSALTEMRGKNGDLSKRPKPRVVNFKPYLQLDFTQPTAVQHAKMSLRMLRPWQRADGDPMRITTTSRL